MVADVVRRRRGQLRRPAPGDGIDAQLYWPGLGEVPATELVLRRLLPMAHAGPGRVGRRHARSATGCSASSSAAAPPTATARSGRRETFHRIDEQKQPLDRRDALREMLRRYIEHMHTNEPVADWPV